MQWFGLHKHSLKTSFRRHVLLKLCLCKSVFVVVSSEPVPASVGGFYTGAVALSEILIIIIKKKSLPARTLLLAAFGHKDIILDH